MNDEPVFGSGRPGADDRQRRRVFGSQSRKHRLGSAEDDIDLSGQQRLSGKRGLHPDEFYVEALTREVTLVLRYPKRQQRGADKKRADAQSLALLAPGAGQDRKHDAYEKREKCGAEPHAFYSVQVSSLRLTGR